MDSTDREAQILKAWTSAFSSEVLSHATPKDIDNEDVFADVYHSLVHSPLAPTLLQLEHTNAEAVAAKCQEREAEREAMEDRHEGEMARAVEEAEAAGEGDGGAAERRVNGLAQQHLEERQMAMLRWESDLGHLRDTQHREFRSWVMCVHEEMKTNENKNGGGGGVGGSLGKSESAFSLDAPTSRAPVLQESFTITLGAQMKQMHNLRLVAADALDLCRYPESDALPQRLSTSMSLYSNSLCGLVLLTDGRLNAYSGAAREFAEICQRSTEYHFPPFEAQLAAVRDDHAGKGLAWRKEHRRRKALRGEEGSETADVDLQAKYSKESNTSLRPGDFYITRHSNLCETHAMFHLVRDDSVLSSGINSRHPCVLGLRNVLKTASLSDVTTVTLPLLLAGAMTEEMTVQWCLKRAELVFKCVKGFMMEVASWGGSEIRTLQFLVPREIDQEVFNRLTGMLAGIFRTSNPIRGQ